jgi:hypothetical protein
MKKYLLVISTIILVFSGGLAFQAQSTSSSSNGNNPVNVFGKVSNINLDANQITILTTDGKNIVATFDKAVEFKQVPAGETTLRNATDITSAQINAGDNALVRGNRTSENNIFARQIIIVTQADIIKKQDRKREEWKLRGIAGIVQKVDLGARKIFVQTKGANSQLIELVPTDKTIFQRYETDAGSLNDFKPGNLERIKEGDQIRALGDKSADGRQFVPEEVFSGSFRILTGKVLAVNPEAGELKLSDLQNGKTVTAVVNSASNLRRLTGDSVKSEAGLTAKGGARETAGGGSINLTSLLEKSPKINIADIKIGETIVIASLSDAGAERLIGITVVSGVEILNIRGGNKSDSNPNRKFNLDVF